MSLHMLHASGAAVVGKCAPWLLSSDNKSNGAIMMFQGQPCDDAPLSDEEW